MRTMFTTLAALLLSFALALPASAKTPLREVREIDDNMLWVGIALRVSEECGEISARKVKGLNFLWSLKTRANELGYSDAEIDAYRKSPAEKARIEAKGAAYVKSRGFDPNSAAGLCAFGKAEIARGSVIGGLLRAR